MYEALVCAMGRLGPALGPGTIEDGPAADVPGLVVAALALNYTFTREAASLTSCPQSWERIVRPISACPPRLLRVRTTR